MVLCDDDDDDIYDKSNVIHAVLTPSTKIQRL